MKAAFAFPELQERPPPRRDLRIAPAAATWGWADTAFIVGRWWTLR